MNEVNLTMYSIKTNKIQRNISDITCTQRNEHQQSLG